MENLDPRTARQNGLKADSGVVVTEVDPASGAASSGLKEGDVIQEMNHHRVTNANEFASAMRRSKGDSLLLVNRGGNKLYLAV